MKTIKLLLTENVDNLGIVGDVVSVRSGYARNFLLPRAMATKPTEAAVKRLATRRAEVEREMKELRAKQEALIEKLKGLELTIMRSANEQGVLFGSVSQHDISQALKTEGHHVEDRAVRIGQQIKRLDTYTIPIVLASDLRTEIKLWVVSDKPTEQLETQKEAKAEGTHGEAGEEKPRKGKPRPDAEAQPEAEAKSDAKPAKKGRKAEPAGKAKD